MSCWQAGSCSKALTRSKTQNATFSVKFEDVWVAWRSLLLRLVQEKPESWMTVTDFVDSKSALANLIGQSSEMVWGLGFRDCGLCKYIRLAVETASTPAVDWGLK